MHYVMINGRTVPADEAAIPMADRGFRYGDGLFETLRLHDGIPYRFSWHMNRLAKGLAGAKIPFDMSQLQPLCAELITLNGSSEGFIRIQVTRGSGSQGYLPVSTRSGEGALFTIECMPSAVLPKEPVALWLSQYPRFSAGLLDGAKTCQGLNSTLARMEAQEHDCFEALQLNERAELCEGSSSNLFWLKNGTLFTPSLATGALGGSIRSRLKDISPWPVLETVEGLEALADAEAVFVTNVNWKILPAASLAPAGFLWDSIPSAARLSAVLHEDIEHHCSQAAWQ